jgi:phage terminase large subunit-like protein
VQEDHSFTANDIAVHNSLTVNVFWPAWEWGPMEMPWLRYVAFSYGSHLTERDNAKFRDLVCSPEYREMWGHIYKITGDGKIKVTNDAQGFKFASSIGGVGTGERGDRVLLDDPHKVDEAESDPVRKGTVQWFRESMSNRLNDLAQSVIVVIMQRVHEEDVSAAALEDGDYVHLCIPFEYEAARHCSTVIGWEDPRTEEGEPAWPERFRDLEMRKFKRQIYLWAGQYQQRPSPRGGGIIKEDYWQTYEVPRSRAYDFQPIFMLASLDTAFKEKEENDFSALTVWAVYDDEKTRNRRIILVDAWKRRLPLHGPQLKRGQNEPERAYIKRCMPTWGLVEWVNFTCTRRKVDRLIIEDASRGVDVNNEIRRVFGARNWGIHLVPARGDKWARVHSIVDLFTDGMVYAPGEWLCRGHARPFCPSCPEDETDWAWREWAGMVVTDCAVFPKGAHDDIPDSVSQALKHLRETGLAIRREERQLSEELQAKQRPQKGVAVGYFS